jgi:hypothetical protein
MMEGARVGEFLIRLGDDPDLLARYKQDPYPVMDEAGLSPEQQDLIMSGDVRRIREDLRREYPDAEVFLLPAWNHIIQRV